MGAGGGKQWGYAQRCQQGWNWRKKVLKIPAEGRNLGWAVLTQALNGSD